MKPNRWQSILKSDRRNPRGYREKRIDQIAEEITREKNEKD